MKAAGRCRRLILAAAVIVGMISCAGRGTPSREEALRPAAAPILGDDLNRETLVQGITRTRAALSTAKTPEELQFGPRRIRTQSYLDALACLAAAADQLHDDQRFFAFVREHFDFYEVFGDRDWGDVVMTSYYEPIISGSRTKSQTYSQALYRTPADFHEPYYSRREVNSDGALEGLGLELCYVDPVDAYLLQTQGSGVIAFEDGTELRLQFAAKNGLPYQGLGKALRKVMPDGDLRLPRIEAYLRSLPESELNELLSVNPSYVFFAPSKTNALTSMQIPATAGRTIATDRKFFPKGAVAYLVFQKPTFADDSCESPVFVPAGRFVLDQDVGSAIRGPGRIDLFWGRGDEAKRSAGVIHSHAKLYYLVPK